MNIVNHIFEAFSFFKYFYLSIGTGAFFQHSVHMADGMLATEVRYYIVHKVQ